MAPRAWAPPASLHPPRCLLPPLRVSYCAPVLPSGPSYSYGRPELYWAQRLLQKQVLPQHLSLVCARFSPPRVHIRSICWPGVR